MSTHRNLLHATLTVAGTAHPSPSLSTTPSASVKPAVETGLGDWPDFCCPLHRERLRTNGNFLCCSQGERFPVREGIPRFVKEKTYADAFGAQWKRYRLTQLDSFTGVSITEERMRRCLGEGLWEKLGGSHVLECGCGAGRFTEVLLQRGALVTSLDLSDAVDANQLTFPQSSTHRIAQADILQLPFAPRQFDVVLCLGVIQHTPSPESTVRALAEHVKPGGSLIIDHYTYTLSEFTKTSAVLRPFFKRLPPATGLQWTEWIVNTFLPLHKRVRRFRWAQALLSRISPIICYYHIYPHLSEEMQYQWALVDTHDSLTCWFRRFRTCSQIERLMKSLGFEEIACSYKGNGVEARGKRPASSSAVRAP
jgi:2-polyprenyl-3-methyl-5-hydroxy-6-metoxy-1,4-benzoquinol methylase